MNLAFLIEKAETSEVIMHARLDVNGNNQEETRVDLRLRILELCFACNRFSELNHRQCFINYSVYVLTFSSSEVF